VALAPVDALIVGGLCDDRKAPPARKDCEFLMSDTSLRLLTVHAHPDDESSKGAATVAR
jgi:hypothetical protein